MLQMGDTVGLRYTAPKISAISYLFGTFSLLIMGDTALYRFPRSIGPRYNGAAVYNSFNNFRCRQLSTASTENNKKEVNSVGDTEVEEIEDGGQAEAMNTLKEEKDKLQKDLESTKVGVV